MLSRLKTSGSEFINWWLEGLALCLPRGLREKLSPPPDRLHLRAQAGRISLTLIHGADGATVESPEYPLDAAETAGQITRWIDDHADAATRIYLLTEPESLLCKDLSLPLAGEDDLRDILRFEMDRHTPFCADQVYYGFRILERDKPGGKLRLRLFVLPRNPIQPLLQIVRGHGRPLHGILADAAEEGADPIDLLSREERSPTNGGPGRGALAGALICGLFLLAALYLPVVRQQRALHGLEAQLNTVRRQVHEIQPRLDEREDLLRRGRFLQEKREARLPAVALLAELTRILPDDAWINRLVFQDREVQLFGEAATETGLIQILESSPLLHDARFRSPVTYNNASGKHNFHISATAGREPGS